MERILVIEDNRMLCDNIVYLLQKSGYDAVSRYTGEEGIEAAKLFAPSLILCDIELPAMDGYEVLKTLSGDVKTALIPFIFLTGKKEMHDIRRGMNLGADDYIPKPIKPFELLSSIQSRLAKAKMVRKKSLLGEKFKFKDATELYNYIKENGKIHTVNPNEIIYKENQPIKYVYLLLDGIVKVYSIEKNGKELISQLIKPNQMFGLMGLGKQENYKNYSSAVTKSEIAMLTLEKFNEILYESREVNEMIIDLLSESLGGMSQQLSQMAYGTVRYKTAQILLKLSQDNIEMRDIRIPRYELASLAGIAKESATRTLQDFKNEGFINIKGRSIVVLDRDKLKEIN